MLCIWSIGYPNRPWPFIFIGWGGLIPQEILLHDLNLLKPLVVLGFHLDRSDRSAAAGPTTACVPKNTLLDQNYLRAMNTSAIFCAKGDNNLSAISYFFFELTTKQLASIPTSWSPTLLVQPPLTVPWTLSCASIAISSFECETNLRDTTSAVDILNLVLCSSHTPCCNQCPFWPDYR